MKWTRTSLWVAHCLRAMGGWSRADKGRLRRLLLTACHYYDSELRELEQAGYAETRSRRTWYGKKVWEWRLTPTGWWATVPGTEKQ